jgi:Protein of Unknown function (DUF2784)
MLFRLFTDTVIIVHFAFLAFVVGGGFLVRRYRWLIVPHLLAVAWGVYVEARPGMLCPLTPLENHFARLAGGEGYEGGYIEHYLVPIIYPDGLTPTAQRWLAMALIAVNVIAYTWPRRTSGVKSRSGAA